MDNNSLSHHGVMGMKWGRRRYQNKDGSLTPAGKSRHDRDTHDDYKKAHDRKNVKYMSDKELRERNNRLQMEQQYKNLSGTGFNGKKVVNTFIATAGTLSAAVAAYGTYKTLANKGLDKIGDMIVSSINLSGPLTK